MHSMGLLRGTIGRIQVISMGFSFPQRKNLRIWFLFGQRTDKGSASGHQAALEVPPLDAATLPANLVVERAGQLVRGAGQTAAKRLAPGGVRVVSLSIPRSTASMR